MSSYIFGGFDILGLGTLLGSILFLIALLWVLVDNRSFDAVSRRHAAAAEPPTAAPSVAFPPIRAEDPESPDTDGGPGRPSRPKRAA